MLVSVDLARAMKSFRDRKMELLLLHLIGPIRAAMFGSCVITATN